MPGRELYLNDLLVLDPDIDPKGVLVLRHRPSELGVRKVLPWLAAERPSVFNAYQQTQGANAEKAMKRASYVASFIGHMPGKAVFVGLYSVGSSKPLTVEQFWRVPGYRELREFGLKGFTGDDGRSSILWFDLQPTGFRAEWRGKLVVAWPPPELAWYRVAGRNRIPVHAILEDSLLDARMPSWDELILTWEELRALPGQWRAALAQWRGIYFIYDESDGKGYVGAAYGDANILGRWQNYAERGHGGNALLRGRDPHNFRFSILQRVSPDTNMEDVVRFESTWKGRLHTRHPRGLNEN